MITNVLIKTGAWSASLALLFFTGPAKGQGIIYGQPSQPIYYSAGTLDNTVDIDVNGDGTPDFAIISTSSYTADIAPLGNNSIIAVPAPPPNLGYFVANIPAGTEISSTTPITPNVWYNNQTDQFGSAIIGAMAGMTGPPLGYFTGDSSAYVGFDLVANGENYYRWIQLSSPYPFVAGQVVDWAYESSPNTPIDAGAVPEPATWALGLAGTLILAFRRNKLTKGAD